VAVAVVVVGTHLLVLVVLVAVAVVVCMRTPQAEPRIQVAAVVAHEPLRQILRVLVGQVLSLCESKHDIRSLIGPATHRLYVTLRNPVSEP